MDHIEDDPDALREIERASWLASVIIDQTAICRGTEAELAASLAARLVKRSDQGRAQANFGKPGDEAS